MNLVFRPFMGAFRLASRLLPPGMSAGRVLGLPLFLKFHRRLPCGLGDPRAGLEDYIFMRNPGPWGALHRECVDKETAKAAARRLCPKVQTVPTRAVFTLGPRTSFEDLRAFLAPFLGKPFVAKPTHSSGGVALLDRAGPQDLRKLWHKARKDHGLQNGEFQYRHLPRKVLVEDSLARPGQPPPADYRFHCARGRAFFGAVDVGRFQDLREYHFTVPRFHPVYLPGKKNLPDHTPVRPPRFHEMLEIAEALSKPFDYVRVDLYQTPQGVFFGEFTFTPLGGLFHLGIPGLSRWLLLNITDPAKAGPFRKGWKRIKP